MTCPVNDQSYQIKHGPLTQAAKSESQHGQHPTENLCCWWNLVGRGWFSNAWDPAQAQPGSQSEHPLRTAGNVNSGFGNLADVHLVATRCAHDDSLRQKTTHIYIYIHTHIYAHRTSGTPSQNDEQSFLGELGIPDAISSYHYIIISTIYNYL